MAKKISPPHSFLTPNWDLNALSEFQRFNAKNIKNSKRKAKTPVTLLALLS